MPHEESVALIIDGKAKHFDPAIVDAFVRVSSDFKRVSRRHDESRSELPMAG
jgi:putative two-component system response regulator